MKKTAPHIFIQTAALLLLAGIMARAEEEPRTTGAPPPPKYRYPEYAPVEDAPGLPRVLLIGDSISIGYTLPARAGLKAVANLHRPPENCGDTGRGLRRLDAWLGAGKWDVIHFNFGLHDIKYLDQAGKYTHPSQGVQMTSPEQYEKNLRALVRRLKDTGAVVIFATTTPVPDNALARVGADVIRYNKIAAEIMEREGVALNDLFALASETRDEIQLKQNVHFTRHGYQLMADRVVEKIKTALAKREKPKPVARRICIRGRGTCHRGPPRAHLLRLRRLELTVIP
jgi:acyl-CoA thioesterase-1